MNLYLVISEEIEEIVWEEYPVAGHPEYYRIAELVLAENAGQAKYDAWKKDKYSFSKDIRDIPKMSVKLLEKNIYAYRGIVSYDPKYQKYWGVDVIDDIDENEEDDKQFEDGFEE